MCGESGAELLDKNWSTIDTKATILSEGAQFFSEEIKAKSNTIPGIFLVMARSLALLLGVVAVLVDAQKFCPKERKGDKCKAKELG